MKDKWLTHSREESSGPFDCGRMRYGGFKTPVGAEAPTLGPPTFTGGCVSAESRSAAGSSREIQHLRPDETFEIGIRHFDHFGMGAGVERDFILVGQ